uniref:Uncharacterized protein n=1 Tax=Oryza glumipatula TaxID=40148 RepID=A0A0D9ZLL5_9ORYZ
MELLQVQQYPMAANRKLLFCFAILVATAILLVSLLTLAVPDLVVAAGEEEKYGRRTNDTAGVLDLHRHLSCSTVEFAVEQWLAGEPPDQHCAEWRRLQVEQIRRWLRRRNRRTGRFPKNRTASQVIDGQGEGRDGQRRYCSMGVGMARWAEPG